MINNGMARPIRDVEKTCSTCGGRGRVLRIDEVTEREMWIPCEDCDGKGYYITIE
jgi:DnaJ-class molecular chaperone